MIPPAGIRSAGALALVLGLTAPQGIAYAAPTGRVVSQQADTDAGRAQRDTAEIHEAPLVVFADIEKAWNDNDVDGILSHFGQQKVWISVEGTGPSGGEFSRNQSYYLLKDLFKYTITRKFEFVQFRKPDEAGKATFAVAERQYQRTDDGRLFKDKIYVSLHLESGKDEERWVVDEIKSIR
jgi:hypothetical protein